jgi:hypothetical protein
MSENQSPGNNVEAAALEARVKQLRAKCDDETRKCEKKRKTSLIAGVALIIVCILCLSRVTSLFFQLDAEALTQIGRIEVEKHLPGSREALQKHLQTMAPEFIETLIKQTLELLPKARQQLTDTMSERLDHLTSTHEAEIRQRLVEGVLGTRTEIDTKLKGASEEEKLEALVAHVCGEFQKVMDASILALYPEFCRELDRIDDYMTSLSGTDTEKLTSKERLHKELIQTFLRMIVTQHQEGKS